MSEFITGLGYLSAVIVGAAGVSFGLCAGIYAATWAFGPFNINVKRGDLNVILRNESHSLPSNPKSRGEYD